MTAQRWKIRLHKRRSMRLCSVVVLAALVTALVAQASAPSVRAASFAAGDSVVVDTDRLNLREGPGLSADVMLVLDNGLELRVTAGPTAADGYDWYEVRDEDGMSGWVAGTYLASIASWTQFEIGDLAIVDLSSLNCRNGPGLDQTVLYIMNNGDGVQILDGPEVADGYHWYKVRTDAEVVGWVIGEGLAVPTARPGAIFSASDQVVVDTDLLNLRAGPSLAADVATVLPYGTPLTIATGYDVADGHSWYEVETRNGRFGWVAGEYLSIAPGLGFALGDAVRVANGSQNLREGPDLDADIIRVMEDGEVLLIEGEPIQGDGYTWYLVRNYAGKGWAAGEFLRFEPDGFPAEEGG